MGERGKREEVVHTPMKKAAREKATKFRIKESAE